MKTRSLAWTEKTLHDAGAMKRAELFGRGDEAWHGAAIDTRAECAGRLFFALKGERTDGHRYAAEAAAKGSLGVVVEKDDAIQDVERTRTPFFVVRNSLAALQELSRAYRGTLDARVVAVTGSSGKTTTKEYIRMILRTKYRVHSNPGNLNNHIGVPLTVLDADNDCEYFVSELAANHVGEIDFLSELLRPDVGVITNIGDAHLGLFGSREKVAEAKAELFGSIDNEGYALLPGDDDFLDALRSRARCRVVTFGRAVGCTFRVTAVVENGQGVRFRVNDSPLSIRGPGVYNVLNACAAFAVGDLCGVADEQVREALAAVEPLAGRGKVHRGGGVVLIDDSYNANPISMRAALETLVQFEGNRKIAVLGDMAELGKFTGNAHRDLGARLAELDIAAVYWLGENAAAVRAGMKKVKSKVRFESFSSTEQVTAAVRAAIEPGDVVMVKASRAVRLDEVVAALCDSVLGGNED